VLIENFRTDSADHLGLTPESLLERHPRLVACSISGYGRTGPWKDVAGYDFAIQALSGLMAITGPVAGPPSKVGVALADVLTGLYASTTILACLRAREQSGHGYAIDLSLLDCAVAAQVNLAQAYLSSGAVPARQGNAHLQIVPYQLFATADGYLVLNVGNDHQWQQFCRTAEAVELGNDERYRGNAQRVRHRDELIPQLEKIMAMHATVEWERRLNAANVPHARVGDYQDLFAHEQIAERGMKISVRDPAGREVDLIGSPVHLHGAPLMPASMPPSLGADTAAVLKNLLSLSDRQIEQLKLDGLI